jgi:hypothetical protein
LLHSKIKIGKKMSTKLYVGNLSFGVTSEDLQEHFAQAGTVESANVVEDRETGRSRGFGFVEMSSAEEAQAAIERNLVVNEARPREEGGGGGRGGSGGYGGGGGRGGSGGGGGNRGGSGGGGGNYSRW